MVQNNERGKKIVLCEEDHYFLWPYSACQLYVRQI